MVPFIERVAIMKRELEIPSDLPVQQAISKAYELMGWQLGDTPLFRAVERLFLHLSPDGLEEVQPATASSAAAHDISREEVEEGHHSDEDHVEQVEDEHADDGDKAMKVPAGDHERLLKGVRWGNRTDCTAYIKRINLEHFNKRVYYVKNGLSGESGYILACSCPACRYKVVIRRKRFSNPKVASFFWVDVNSSVLAHDMPACTSSGKASVRFLCDSEAFRAQLQKAAGDGESKGHRTTAKELQQVLKDAVGIDTTIANIYAARMIIEHGSWDEYESSFGKFPGWLEKFCEDNAGSVGVCEVFEEGPQKGAFRRAFLSCGSIVHHIKCCGLRLLSQETFLLTHKWFTGKIVIVQGRTSDGCEIPVAAGLFAVGRSVQEDDVEESIKFVWDQLRRTNLASWINEAAGKITVLTDRGSRVLSGLQQSLPHAHIIYCTTHLLKQINAYCKAHRVPPLVHNPNKDTPGSEDLFWRAQAAGTETTWRMLMGSLEEQNPAAHEFLNQIPPKHWARHAQQDCIAIDDATYKLGASDDSAGEQTAQGETIRTRLKLSKCAGPLEFYQRLARMWAEAVDEARLKGEHFASCHPDDTRSLFVNDATWSEYTDLTERSKSCKVLDAQHNAQLVEVFGRADKDGLRPKFVVSLSRRQCSPCSHWIQTLRPCEHAIAASLAVGWGSGGSRELVEKLFNPVWLADNFVASVSHPSFVPCRVPCPEGVRSRDDFLPGPPIKASASTDDFLDPEVLLQRRKRGRERGEGREGEEEELASGLRREGGEPAKGEELYTTAGNRKKTCKVCGSVGHNRRSCTAV